MNDLFVRIRFLLPSLPRAEKAIASALLENPEAITHLTLEENQEAVKHQLSDSVKEWDMMDILL
mgnify:CR=1 FL=1